MRSFLHKSLKWSISIAVITAVLAAIFSLASTSVLNQVDWTVGLLVVLAIVVIGVFFDMLGIAATAADEKPYHSMASNKVYGARHSIRIVRNADRFASFCNDVIGDIAGIISGAAATIVIIQLAQDFQTGTSSVLENSLNIGLTSIIAALTVGGKAIGKSIAIQFSRDIIFQVGKTLQFLEEKLHIVIIKDTKKNKTKKQDN
ncbi:hypothetical protein [Jeotgalibacillus proteolyticus]|uniref:CNNM transmembrane domain-containing protein n=1 Tax=Jeotgalibacillus proteolyticus TaxID=2082395 RepID=A0A2S5GEM9_9BACL|nr:hypothetical protein [Jeotgalibacillus proteolyticus]PPA71365.1 hypothetical protein C4B60_04690 [Jeotgalibacillus proteolyticus]